MTKLSRGEAEIIYLELLAVLSSHKLSISESIKMLFSAITDICHRSDIEMEYLETWLLENLEALKEKEKKEKTPS